MVKKGSGAGKCGPPARRIALLLLPPGGERAGSWLEGAVADAWSPAGPLSTVSVAVDGGRRGLARAIRRYADREHFQVICSIGRSGAGREDFVPDLTRSLLDRTLPGIEERMYLGPPRRPEDLLFRGAAGIRGETMIINLPERPERTRAVLRFLAPVLGHALDKIAGDESECGRPLGKSG
jgi:molybdopterin biosynthesis enzyme MoaB